MGRKEENRRKARKKLTLSKETIRDLTPKKDNTAAVRGGGGRNTVAAYGC